MAGPVGPRLAGRLTAELILRSPQYMSCVGYYELDLRGEFGNKKRLVRVSPACCRPDTQKHTASARRQQDRRHREPGRHAGARVPSWMSLSMPRGPSVVRTASATAWHALMFETSCALPWLSSVPSRSRMIWGCNGGKGRGGRSGWVTTVVNIFEWLISRPFDCPLSNKGLAYSPASLQPYRPH